jgi:DNA modification methylase
MKNLLKRKKYNAGKRPSGHNISQEGFLTDNGGSISQNFFETEPINSKIAPRLTNAFRLSNTDSNDFFSKTCRERGIERHPAPIQAGLISFFIEMLTDEKDLVLDPFGGTNTTGFIAELLNRHWVSIEIEEKYADQSRIRFEDPTLEDIKKTRKQKLNSEDLNIARDK